MHKKGNEDTEKALGTTAESKSLETSVNRSNSMCIEPSICFRERFGAEEASISGKRGRMRRSNDQMFVRINQRNLLLSKCSSQDKNQMRLLLGKQANYRISEELSSNFFVCIGTIFADREGSIEEEDPLFCPGTQISSRGNRKS